MSDIPDILPNLPINLEPNARSFLCLQHQYVFIKGHGSQYNKVYNTWLTVQSDQ